eukprot:gene4509-6733_t
MTTSPNWAKGKCSKSQASMYGERQDQKVVGRWGGIGWDGKRLSNHQLTNYSLAPTRADVEEPAHTDKHIHHNRWFLRTHKLQAQADTGTAYCSLQHPQDCNLLSIHYARDDELERGPAHRLPETARPAAPWGAARVVANMADTIRDS